MTTEVEAATKILATLEDERDNLIARMPQLAQARQTVAYAAKTGDKGAKDKLAKVNAESVAHEFEIASVDAAICEAVARLNAAKQAEAASQDRSNAVQLREKLARFVELGGQLDDAVWDVAGSLKEMVALLHDMHALGQSAPTSEQFRVNGTMALKSMLQELPNLWVKDFDFQLLAPNQKKQFKTLVEGWSQMIENNIESRLQSSTEQKREVA